MVDVVLYTRPDGGVSVVHPAPGIGMDEVMDRSIPTDATSVRVVDHLSIPTDREFRNAWFDDGTGIDHDMTKCRSIQKERIDRAKLQKARSLLEREMLGENIVAEKAKIRAINSDQIVGAALDLAALKASFPADLRKKGPPTRRPLD